MERPFRELHELFRIVYKRSEAQAEAERKRQEEEKKKAEAEAARNKNANRARGFEYASMMHNMNKPTDVIDETTPPDYQTAASAPYDMDDLEEAFEEMAGGGVM